MCKKTSLCFCTHVSFIEIIMRMIAMASQKLKLVYLGAVLAITQYFFQEIIFTEAGQEKESKAYAYEFQLNYWGEKIYDKFGEIQKSGAASRIILGKNTITITPEFFVDLDTYQQEMKDMLRILEMQYQISLYLIKEIDDMASLGFATREELAEFKSEWDKFELLLEEHKKRKERLDTFFPEFMAAFSDKNKTLTEEQKVELTIKQSELLGELYSSDLLFMKYNSDVFKFVRELAEQSHYFIHVYEDIRLRYNARSSVQNTFKQTIISLITFISIIVGVRIEESHKYNKRLKRDCQRAAFPVPMS